MGEVYLARDEQLERDVAIKILPAAALADVSARSRLNKEAIALSRLNHPNIATIYEVDTQDQVDFLVMEYVPGPTLSEKLARGALPEKEIIRLGTQLAEGLAAAHGQGVVHRDLKPGNLAVTPDGRLKILDFGLAKLLRPSSEDALTEGVSKSGGTPGTLPYMSPEQLRGEAPDTRSDLYAAGVVLYEMATGQRLVAASKGLARAMDVILHHPAPAPSKINPQISPGLESIILKCLEKEAGNRYQSAIELAVDLHKLSEGAASAGASPLAVRSTSGGRRRMAALAAGLLITVALGAAYFARQRLWSPGNSSEKRIMLAVLPFDNLSGDPEQEYFSDGLTEEMIAQLGKLQPRRLGVIARTSAMHYKGSRERIDQIGRELSVGYILEGSVRRQEGRVRITAELIQVADQTPLWTESYERDVAGVFAVQDEVAGRITRSLALELLPSQQVLPHGAATTNPAAYDAYLKGRYNLSNVTAEHLKKAMTYFQKAVELDPNYAPAYAGLADYYWGTDELPPRVAMPKAEGYALKSLELDDTLSEAHTALAAIRFFGNRNWLVAEKEFRRALDLNPSDAEAHRLYSLYLIALGRADEAFGEIQLAQDLDPLSLNINTSRGWVLYYARQYDRAVEQCRKTLDVDPDHVSAHDCQGESYLAKGMYEQAIAELQQAASSNDPVRVVALARASATAGKRNEARELLDRLTEISRRSYFPPYLLAGVHVALGERDQAFVWLEKAYTEGDAYLVHLKVDAALDPVRSDPRFQDLLRRLGFPP
jgi:serine/threonine-protein kinase